MISMRQDNRDHYEVLGINQDSSTEEIKKSYSKRAKECHPDLHPDDFQADEKIKRVNEAYETLIDDGKRTIYDREQRDKRHRQFETIGNKPRSTSSNSDFTVGLERARRHQVKPDYVIRLTPLKARTGMRMTLPINIKMKCGACGGTGGAGPRMTCPRCKGWGTIAFTKISSGGSTQTASSNCPACNGKGSFHEKICASCNGEGTIMKEIDEQLDIPPISRDGELFEFTSAGKRYTVQIQIRK